MTVQRTGSELSTTWRFAVRTRPGFPDAEAQAVASDISDLGIPGVEGVEIVRIYYVTGDLTQEQIQRLGERLLTDPILEEWEVRPLSAWRAEPSHDGVVEVAYHPGVRDPVEDSLKKGALDLEIRGIQSVHTAKAYRIRGTFGKEALDRICEKRLVNATIQQIVTPQRLEKILSPLQASPMAIETVHLLGASDTVLQRVSLDHQLSLNLEEMRAIQSHYRNLDREPTLIELETIAQTWSEHCKHKTFRGDIVYTEESGGKTEKRVIRDLLKETIMRSTQELNRPWCVSTFSDNAGVIEFDEEFHVCFKVETHNHPSALEPFGGASTGMGGVIRDILGTGCAAKPVASTDIFCFAPPDFPQEEVPPGLLHPRRLIKGVVAGIKDYGNKMGIPTVNGAVLFDRRFVGNPLVYCGNVGLLPRRKTEKLVSEGMAIVLAGGRTGRDGIHGATFSSLGLDTESEVIYSTAVQIGDPITEKKLTDAILAARDQDLFESITDCGAGGLSSAVGEMGAGIGARVELSSVPLKYAGLTPAEIWISESQERMVLAVLPEKLEALLSLLKRYGVEAADVGKFTSTGNLELFFKAERVGELSMDFLHHGLPKILKPARWKVPQPAPLSLPEAADLTGVLLQLLGQWDTCSKEWIVRQYDHEVQGGSVLKPLVEGGRPDGGGLASSSQSRSIGPSDAAVVRPRLDSKRGIALSNGINFRYGDLDPYQMALLNLDEAVRQIICVGGSLERIALLDNFCFGNPTRVCLGIAVGAGSLKYSNPNLAHRKSPITKFQAPNKFQ